MRPEHIEILTKAAKKYDISVDYLINLAMAESNGNPYATSKKSSAKGLFQLTDKTSESLGVKDPFNVYSSAFAVAKMSRDHIDIFRNKMGRDPTDAELYVAHQQGINGALSLLKNPDKLAIESVSKDAIVNNKGNVKMTGREFFNVVANYYKKHSGSETASSLLPISPPYEQKVGERRFGSNVPAAKVDVSGVKKAYRLPEKPPIPRMKQNLPIETIESAPLDRDGGGFIEYVPFRSDYIAGSNIPQAVSGDDYYDNLYGYNDFWDDKNHYRGGPYDGYDVGYGNYFYDFPYRDQFYLGYGEYGRKKQPLTLVEEMTPSYSWRQFL